MSTLNLGVYRVARQAMLPEDRLFERLEVRFIPYIHTEFLPFRMPGMLIIRQSAGLGTTGSPRVTVMVLSGAALIVHAARQ